MRIKTSYLWALLIAAAIVGWMLSGRYLSSEGTATSETAAIETGAADTSAEAQSKSNDLPVQRLTISALEVVNQSIPMHVRASGVTRTSFEVSILARRDAFISAITAKEGSWVKKGDIIAELDKGTLEADIAASRADRQSAVSVYEDAKKRFSSDGTLAAQLNAAAVELAALKKTYDANLKLAQRGLQTELNLSNQRAQVTAAQTRLFELQSLSKEKELTSSYAAIKAVDARLAMLEEQLSFTTITAPQDGWIETIHVEQGEFVSNNKAIAHLLGLQKLVLDVPVPQVRVNDIRKGDVADISITGMGAFTGEVSKIASTANTSTRTFTIEVSIDNPEGTILSGMSAEASIIIGEIDAFEISPAHLNVNADGQLTAKIVDESGRVAIADVELIRTSGNSAFIAGLENGTIVLAAGQAFLASGEEVSYELEDTTGDNS